MQDILSANLRSNLKIISLIYLKKLRQYPKPSFFTCVFVWFYSNPIKHKTKIKRLVSPTKSGSLL